MKLRFLTAFLVLAALFAGVALWRFDRFVYGDRMAWAESQARSQLSSLTQAINAEIKSGRRMLSTVTGETFKPEATNWGAFQPYYSLALMTTGPEGMSITRMVSKPESPAAGWNANQLTQQLGFLGKELESKSAVILRSFRDSQKRQHVALIFAGSGTAYILVGSGENFQGLIDSQKGSMNSFAIVAADGLTISHPVPDYIGNVMSDSSLLKEIRTSGAVQGVGTFVQGQKKIFGMYEKVTGTNSYVLSTVPLEDLLRGRISLVWLFVSLGAGFLLLGTALYYWYEKNRPHEEALLAGTSLPPSAPPKSIPPSHATVPTQTSSANVAKKSVTPAHLSTPGAPIHAAAVVVSNSALVAPSAPRSSGSVGAGSGNTMTPEEPSQDKSEAYRQVASALGQEMRAPIASIVGFSQMVLSKTQDPEVVQAVESILREARSSRDVLEKLSTFTGERRSEKSEGKIEGPITQALKKFETVFRDKGVAVEKHFGETTPWPMDYEDMVKVFENIFSNAVEAMERMQDKVLKISVQEGPDGLHVQVADSGEGIAAENLSKIFDPFYTTRSFAHHVGLGLPVVYGMLKEHHAEVQIKSIRGQGTQVEIHFSPEAKSAHRAAPVMKAPPAPAMLDEQAPAPQAPPFAPPPDSPTAATLARSSAPLPIDVIASKQESGGRSKLTNVNVDKLLDISSDEMPLEFLDGQGFSDMPEKMSPPSIPPMSIKPNSPPPRIQLDEVTDPLINTKELLEEVAAEAVSEIEAVEADQGENLTTSASVAEINTIATGEDATRITIPSTTPDLEAAIEDFENNDIEDPTANFGSAPPPNFGSAPPPPPADFGDDGEDVDQFVSGPNVTLGKPTLPNRPPPIYPDQSFPNQEAPMAAQEALDERMEAGVGSAGAPAPKVIIDKPKPRAPTGHSALDSYKVEIRRPGKRT